MAQESAPNKFPLFSGADSGELLPWILGVIAVVALLIWNFVRLAD